MQTEKYNTIVNNKIGHLGMSKKTKRNKGNQLSTHLIIQRSAFKDGQISNKSKAHM